MRKNEIGLISKKVSVIFYNDKSEIAKYVKSFSIDLYTDKTFTSYVVKNSEISLDTVQRWYFHFKIPKLFSFYIEITFKQPLNVFA